MEQIYPVKPCPWCKRTATFYMFYGAKGRLEETFMPKIKCMNGLCTVQPESKPIPIRKKQRFDVDILKIKIEKAIINWNAGNPQVATEGIKLDFEAIAKEILSYL